MRVFHLHHKTFPKGGDIARNNVPREDEIPVVVNLTR